MAFFHETEVFLTFICFYDADKIKFRHGNKKGIIIFAIAKKTKQ